MALFSVLACLAPPAAGLGVAAALALTRESPVRRRLGAALSVLGAVLGALGIGSLPVSFRGYPAAALVTAAFAALLAGFFLFGESLRLSPALCQLAAGLLAAALVGSVFLFAPLLRQAEESGRPLGEISHGVTRALEVNPLMVLGYSVLGRDLLRTPGFYPLGLGSYPFALPRWERTAAGYAVAGFLFFAAGLAARAVREVLRPRRRPAGGTS